MTALAVSARLSRQMTALRYGMSTTAVFILEVSIRHCVLLPASVTVRFLQLYHNQFTSIYIYIRYSTPVRAT